MTHGAGQSSDPAVWTATELASSPHERPDKAIRVRTMFDRIAPRYDLNNRLHSFGRDQAWRRGAVRLARVTETDDVLDVACGTGDLAEAFADGGAATVTGLDFSEGMLELAERKARLRSRDGQATPIYVHGDATALAFDDASFDVVSIAFGLRNVDEPARALAEFHRVLRPGGRAVILEFAEPRFPPARAICRFYTHVVMPWTATLIARDRSGAYRYLPRSVETFLDGPALAAALETAGFTDVRTKDFTFGVCAATVGVKG